MDTSRQPLNILISGGGTGGHIFPALSIADAIRRRHPDANIQFVGALGRMEMQRVPDAGYPITGLPVSGFDRHRPWRNIRVLWNLWRSMRRARSIIRTFRPHIAIGVGGYASGPTLKAAQRAGIPTLIQEQNSYAGVTNRLLARRARAICVAYDNMDRQFPPQHIIKTGNPVRHNIINTDITPDEARRRLGFPPDRPLIAIIGGSLGARTLNDAMTHAMQPLLDRGASILWQCGRYYATQYQPLQQGHNNITITDFISDMATLYRAADIIVSRAGAGTISELQITGTPAILIPSPNVAEDHQRHNAQALADRDAAIMILDRDARRQLLPTILDLLDNPDRRSRLSHNLRLMALPDASDHIADIVDTLI